MKTKLKKINHSINYVHDITIYYIHTYIQKYKMQIQIQMQIHIDIVTGTMQIGIVFCYC
jgi:hypothetical protein